MIKLIEDIKEFEECRDFSNDITLVISENFMSKLIDFSKKHDGLAMATVTFITTQVVSCFIATIGTNVMGMENKKNLNDFIEFTTDHIKEVCLFLVNSSEKNIMATIQLNKGDESCNTRH